MINIAANVRAIDTIKSEILSEVSNLYRTLALYDSDAVYDEVSGEIATDNRDGLYFGAQAGTEL